MIDTTGQVFREVTGISAVMQGEPYWLLAARNASGNSSNYHYIHDCNIDGRTTDGHVIIAAAECGTMDRMVLHNAAGPCVTFCNQYKDSGKSTMQYFVLRDCRMTSDGKPVVLFKHDTAIISDIRLDNCLINSFKPVSAAIRVELCPKASQFDQLVITGGRAEVPAASRFIEFRGNGWTQPGWITIRDISIDCPGPLIYAPGIALGKVIIDGVKWLGGHYGEPAIVAASVGEIVVEGTNCTFPFQAEATPQTSPLTMRSTL